MTSEIATELTYLVIQKQRERGELGACSLDNSHQRLYAIPSLIANRRRFIADVDEFLTDAACSQRVDGVTPSFNGRQK
jgi:hypothetical protein